MAKVKHDWYLKEWLGTLEVSQADLCRSTGYPKAKVSELATGKSRYNRDNIATIADALHLRPHELLMHPKEAMALRQIRSDAAEIVRHIEPASRTGTDG